MRSPQEISDTPPGRSGGSLPASPPRRYGVGTRGGWEPMRLALALALAIALSAPGAALARGRSGNSKCQWIARQLVNADAMRDRAAALDDKYGVDRYEKRIDYLEDHFEE